MFIDVYMTDTRDGKEYKYEDDFDWQEVYEDIGRTAADHIRYMWTEGNYSCDCNRSLFAEVEEELPCCHADENILRLDKIVNRDTGEVIYPEPPTGADMYPTLFKNGFVIV